MDEMSFTTWLDSFGVPTAVLELDLTNLIDRYEYHDAPNSVTKILLEEDIDKMISQLKYVKKQLRQLQP